MGFKLQLNVVPAKRPPAQREFPAEGVLLSEPMLRFRCNEKGCCCSGWDIPFKLEDFLRLHEHLDEADRAALTKQLRLILEPPKPGTRIDDGEQVLHSLKLAGVGEEKACRFLQPGGGCHVHAKYGTDALPDLCIDFPAFGYRQPGAPVELFYDPVCPEVLERLAESDEPLRLHHQPAPFAQPMQDLRVQHAVTGVQMSLGGAALDPARLFLLRAASVEAFARHKPPWRALAALIEGLRTVDAAADLPPGWPHAPENLTPFFAFLNRCIDAHSADLLVMLLRRFKRFVFALDLEPILAQEDKLLQHLRDWRPAMGQHFAPVEDQVGPLMARWLAHRFAFPFVKQRGELRLAADTIAHLYGTSLRFASALCGVLERPADRAIMLVAIGASEFFYRSLHLPLQALPWMCSSPPAQAEGPTQK